MKKPDRRFLINLLYFIVAISISATIAYMSVEGIEKYRQLNCQHLENVTSTLAQILAEIIAVIIILPQIVLQLGNIPYRRNIWNIFSPLTLLYLGTNILGLVLLSFCIPRYFLGSTIKFAYQSTFFIFIGLLLLIFPFILSQIASYRDPQRTFAPIREKAEKKITTLAKNGQHDGPELREYPQEIKDAVLDYGTKNRAFFKAGILSLIEIFEYCYKLYPTETTFLDNILDHAIAPIGIGMESIEYREFIIDKMKNIQSVVLERPSYAKGIEKPKIETKSEITYFTSKIIEIIVQISIQNKQSVYNQTTSTSLKTIQEIFDECLSSPYRNQVEFHLFAEALRKISLFALKSGHDLAVQDAVQNITLMNTRQIIHKIPIPSMSVFRSCETLVDISILAAQLDHEIFCMESINRLKSFIGDISMLEIPEKKQTEYITTVLANFLEAIGNIWVLFPAMQDWLRHILRRLYSEQHIRFHDYLKPAREIIAMKSAVSLVRFDQFVLEFKS